MLAVAATRGHRSAASRATGPLMSDPFTSPSGVTITQALSSNWTIRPSGRRKGRRCRTTTAFITCLRVSGVPFFTATTRRSAIPADDRRFHAAVLLDLDDLHDLRA